MVLASGLLIRTLVAIAWVLAIAPAKPQAAAAVQPDAADAALQRPRICLVLSGGGARGAAHVGVLKVLDELRVPIDCIAGTSMGAVVGGAYASGNTIAEMERLIANLSTELLFNEKLPRQEQSVRRKQDDLTNLVGPELGYRDRELLLPKGFVSGVQLEAIPRRLAPIRGLRSFDELPIRYRAVATDLATGKAVVFSDGELADAMRASMRWPGPSRRPSSTAGRSSMAG
jgi:NTE family protein